MGQPESQVNDQSSNAKISAGVGLALTDGASIRMAVISKQGGKPRGNSRRQNDRQDHIKHGGGDPFPTSRPLQIKLHNLIPYIILWDGVPNTIPPEKQAFF